MRVIEEGSTGEKQRRAAEESSRGPQDSSIGEQHTSDRGEQEQQTRVAEVAEEGSRGQLGG